MTWVLLEAVASERRWVTNSWRVYFDKRLSNARQNDIREWCRMNCAGSWKIFPQHVRFYDEGDSTLFYLKHA